MQLKGIPFFQNHQELHEDQFEDLAEEDLTKSELETIQNEIMEADKIFEEFLRNSSIHPSLPVINDDDENSHVNQNTNMEEKPSANTQNIEVTDNNTKYLLNPTFLLPKSLPYSETSYSNYTYVQPVATQNPPQKLELMTQNDPVYTATSWDDYEETLNRFRKEYNYVQTGKSSVPYAALQKRAGYDPVTSMTTPYCFAF